MVRLSHPAIASALPAASSSADATALRSIATSSGKGANNPSQAGVMRASEANHHADTAAQAEGRGRDVASDQAASCAVHVIEACLAEQAEAIADVVARAERHAAGRRR